MLEECLERLAFLQRRIFLCELVQPRLCEENLHLHRLLAPERAVIVEGRDALGRRHEVRPARCVTRATKSTIADFAALSFQHASTAQLEPAVASLIFAIASSMVNEFGFCTAGNSLNVSANLAATACAA